MSNHHNVISYKKMLRLAEQKKPFVMTMYIFDVVDKNTSKVLFGHAGYNRDEIIKDFKRGNDIGYFSDKKYTKKNCCLKFVRYQQRQVTEQSYKNENSFRMRFMDTIVKEDLNALCAKLFPKGKEEVA